MHHRLTALLGAVFSAPTRTRLKKRYPPRDRKLLGEQLECRYALSTLVEADILPAPDSSLMVVPAVVSLAPTSDPVAMNPPPADPLPTDPLPMYPPGGGGSYNMPPQINNFAYHVNAGWCILTGTVMDDQDPTGREVQLTGIITASATVAVDDTFIYRFELTAELSGTIYASYQDMYGLMSNIVTVTI